MDQSNSNLLIIAPEHSYSKKLIRYLYQYFNKDDILFEQSNEDHQKIDPLLQYSFDSRSIETKYYTCDINVHYLSYNYFNTNSLMKKVDGIFFIVDANNMTGLDQFTNLCDVILEEAQPGLQAIIYNRKEGTKINYELLEGEEKKLASFVEALYLDLDEQPKNQEAKKLADQDEETLGFSRVIEIMECNTWTGMRPKTQVKEEKLKKVDQLEYEDEQFAQLIHDMTKIRTTQMTDEERRDKAANLMNQLMNMCQDDDDEDL